jgi:hypothetical protein
MIMPGLSLRSWVTIVSVGLVVAVVRVEEGRLARARQQAGELALEASNARALADSTRRVDGLDTRVARVLGDSLRLMERLVVQKEQRQDELDHALRRERIARYGARVTAESLAASSRGEVAASQVDGVGSVRRASFRIRQEPYTLSAEVGLPEAPDTGVMSVRVVLDTLHLETRVGCAAPDANGIRAATVSVAGPRWANVRLDRVEQSPELCASPGLMPPRVRPSSFGRIPLMVGVGPVLDARGRVSLGVVLAAGYGFRR